MIITCETNDIKISVDLDPKTLVPIIGFSKETTEDAARKLLDPLIELFAHSLNALLHMGALVPIYHELLMNKIDEANRETKDLMDSIESGDVSMSGVLSNFIQKHEANKALDIFSDFLKTIDQKPDKE